MILPRFYIFIRYLMYVCMPDFFSKKGLSSCLTSTETLTQAEVVGAGLSIPSISF